MNISRGLFVAVLAGLSCGPSPEINAGSLPEPTTGESAIANCPVDNPDCGPGQGDRCLDTVVAFSAQPPVINQGATVKLAWSVSFPPGCTGQVKVNGSAVPRAGSLTLAPLASLVYRLTSNTGILVTAPVKVNLPKLVRITANGSESRQLLIQALNNPGTRVVLEQNVDMDLTGYEKIYIERGVTLTSEAPLPDNQQLAQSKVAPAAASPSAVAVHVADPPLGRDGHNLGPRLYTTSKPYPLFIMHCDSADRLGDNIRLLGFRLQGPHWDTVDGDENHERGIEISSCLNVEIAHMELSGFSGQAIHIVDPLGRQLNPDEAVRIHDNFIHHNQHSQGEGYGVDVADGAYAAVERNVFDFDRHAITASTGAPGEGYRANQNLVLKGGGHHDTWSNEYTHLFDAHGDANCPDVPLNQHTWNCGNAGEQFWFTNNAFQYTSDKAIKLRGVPRVQAVFSGNVFAKGSLGDSVETDGDLHIVMDANTSGVDTYGEYGVCDFDGDGKDDLFLATGASWWYSNGARSEWIFLNGNTERLRQVGLGDFDGDGHCDVLAASGNTWRISRGGTGAWTPLPGIYTQAFGQLRFGDFNGDRVTDVFYRGPGGQWWVVSPGFYDWKLIGSSSVPLGDLRFGDFNGDGLTDIVSGSGGHWSVSWNGRTAWQTLNPALGDDLSALMIGNVDGLPGDDIIRLVRVNASTSRWDISSGGARPWQTLGTLSWPGSETKPESQAVRTFVGRFASLTGSDVLAIGPARMSSLLSSGYTGFKPHGSYAR